MSIRVLFVDPVTPARLNEIKSMIETVRPKGRDSWEVQIRAEDEGFSLTLTGPDYHRRTFRVYGEHSSEPVYLAALVRTEVNSFPSSPPQDFAFAIAELAQMGIPYDDAELFNGWIRVNGRRFPIETLANLYRSERLSTFRFERTQ